ncbi:class I adenylate-forming enzyme family protein [Spirochaetota bacterium]
MSILNTSNANLLGRKNNIRKLIELKVKQHGDKPFLIFKPKDGGEEILTYRQFDDQVNRLANWYLSKGIDKGDCVMVHLPNSPGFAIAASACLKIGAIMIPSIIFDVADDLEYKLSFSETKMVVTEEQFYGEFEKALKKCPTVKDVLIYRSEKPIKNTHVWNEVIDNSSPDLKEVEIDSMDIAQMMFTSGTTARPKGVLHTHANMLYIGDVCMRSFSVRPEDRYILVLPLFHVNAQCISWYPCLTAGASMVLCEVFSASKYMEMVRQYDVTICSHVAATALMVLNQPEHPLDGESKMWRCPYAISISDEEWNEFERRFNTTLIDLYGLTETLAPCTIMPIWGEHRRGSVGFPNAGMEVKIIDDERKNEMPIGEVGEIAIKGEPGISLFKEYYKNPEATAKELVDNWFYSGDYGKVDEEGYVYFVDRKKDVIQRGGENIAAAEVERVLNDHEEIAECAVIPVPDPIRDEAVMAIIHLTAGSKMTEKDILEYCKPRMAKFKLPTFIKITKEEFPKTSIGKIKKNEMKGEIHETWDFEKELKSIKEKIK